MRRRNRGGSGGRRMRRRAASSASSPTSGKRHGGDADAGVELLHEELARIDRLETRLKSPPICAIVMLEVSASCSISMPSPTSRLRNSTIACIAQADSVCRTATIISTHRRAVSRRRRAYLAHMAAMLEIVGRGVAALADDVFAFETGLAGCLGSRAEASRATSARDSAPWDRDGRSPEPVLSMAFFLPRDRQAPPRRFSLAMPAFHASSRRDVPHDTRNVWRAYLRLSYRERCGAFPRRRIRGHAPPLLRRNLARPARTGAALEANPRRDQRASRRSDGAALHGPMFRRGIEAADRRDRGDACALRCEKARDAIRGWARKRAAPHSRNCRRSRSRSDIRNVGAIWSGLARSRRSLYANVLAARRFELQQRVARIGRPTDAMLWPMPPQSVNAGYDPQRNEIIFPAAILAPPFFDPAADAPLNYGGIGAVIAHEMIHGYDDQGSRFGAMRQLRKLVDTRRSRTFRRLDSANDRAESSAFWSTAIRSTGA